MTLGGSVTLGWGLVIQLVAPIIEVSGIRPLFIAQVTPLEYPKWKIYATFLNLRIVWPDPPSS